MAVSDWSNTASSNTTIGGISIAPNCALGNIDNAIRELMKQIADWYDDITPLIGSGDFQPSDATLTALAALTTSANKLIYATGPDTFATTDFTADGRSLVGAANFAAMRSLLGAGVAPVVSGAGGSSCSIALGGGLVMTTRDFTIAANTSAAQTYGNSYTYTSWARAWIEGDDSGAQDVSMWVTSPGLSSATVFNDGGGSATGVLFSIGV